MARTRSIKPAFFTNDALADIAPLGRLLFAGLWCLADRAGRLADRPRRIKAEVLPYDACDVDALLQDLHDAGFIVRYAVGEARYIQVVNFRKHQSPHKLEPESLLPAPESTPVGPAPDESESRLIQDSDSHESRIPLTLNPYSLNQQQQPRAGAHAREAAPAAAPTAAAAAALPESCVQMLVGEGIARADVEAAFARLQARPNLPAITALPRYLRPICADIARERTAAVAPAAQGLSPPGSTGARLIRELREEQKRDRNGH